MKKKKNISSWAYASLYGVDTSFKYVGHYKKIPIFTRDDVPEGMLYLINESLFDDQGNIYNKDGSLINTNPRRKIIIKNIKPI